MINQFKLVGLLLATMTISACSSGGMQNMELNAAFNEQSQRSVVVMSTALATEKAGGIIVNFTPYDIEAGDTVGKDDTSKGTAFSVDWAGGNFSKTEDDQMWSDHVLDVTPGTYVITSTRWTHDGQSTTYNLGSFMFEVKPGEVVYIGRYTLNLPNMKPITVGGLATDFMKAFFTLGIAGMPEPRLTELVYGSDDSRLAEIMSKYPAIKTTPVKAEFNDSVTFEPGRTQTMWTVKTEGNETPNKYTGEGVEYLGFAK